jgi:hypothetical protein
MRRSAEDLGLNANDGAIARRLRSRSWTLPGGGIAMACALAALGVLCSTAARAEPKKHYWATSLSGTVDASLLHGLRGAVARHETAWLDVDPGFDAPVRKFGLNLIFYHVGGNCAIGSDCNRFPFSERPTDGWGNSERMVDLNYSRARRIVVTDLIQLVQRADELAPQESTVGVHLDNVHRLDADGIAAIFNEYLQAVEVAKQQGLIAPARKVGYVAKNNPVAFRQALDRRLLDAAPLYLINENATLNQDGMLDRASRAAQELGRRYGIPVFLKTFGTDVAYTIEQNGRTVKVYVSQEMTKQMAQLPDIAGAAWSPDEARYQPTLFVQGAPVREVTAPYLSRVD